MLLAVAAPSLLFAALYTHTILALLGIGLTVAALVSTMRREEKVLGEIALSPLRALDDLVRELGYIGKAVYVPPRSSEEFNKPKVFVPDTLREFPFRFPMAGDLHNGKLFHDDPRGIAITPPGDEMMRYYERKLGIRFSDIDLDYLQRNLPQLFVNDLRIVENMKISVNNGRVSLSMAGGLVELCTALRNSTRLDDYIGCPLHSSLALALSRASGRAVVIEELSSDEDGRTVMSKYRLEMVSGAKSYCMKCHQKREMVSPTSATVKNNRKGLKGMCAVCGANMFQLTDHTTLANWTPMPVPS